MKFCCTRGEVHSSRGWWFNSFLGLFFFFLLLGGLSVGKAWTMPFFSQISVRILPTKIVKVRHIWGVLKPDILLWAHTLWSSLIYRFPLFPLMAISSFVMPQPLDSTRSNRDLPFHFLLDANLITDAQWCMQFSFFNPATEEVVQFS